MSQPGLMLILSAPSGAGKTTLAKKLLAAHGERALFSVSCTTRAPRGQERDGVDYSFVSREAFRAMVERGDLLEWAEVHGEWYGSPRATVEAARAGRLVVYDIDVQGGTTIKGKHPEAVSVFVVPPSMEELERRLRGRGTDSEEVIRRRLLAARAEMERGCATYDYVVINRELDTAFADIEAIVRAESCRRSRLDFSSIAPLLGATPR
jgi:guanylate kinase